jgi:hypothetical protein
VNPARRERVTGPDTRQKWYLPVEYAAAQQKLAARELDTRVASVARIYDYLLGGKDNFAADRAAVLHFLTDAEQPGEVVRSLAEALAPGSAVALSHITDEGVGPDKGLAAQEVYHSASAPAIPRARPDITRFLDGLDLVDPGMTDINHWPTRSLGPAAPRESPHQCLPGT